MRNLILLSLVVLAAGCAGNSDNAGSWRRATLGGTNLEGAKALFVAETTKGVTRAYKPPYTRTEEEDGEYTPERVMATPTLFKVTANGGNYKVEFWDELNEPIAVATEGVVNLLNEYVLMRVWYWPEVGKEITQVPDLRYAGSSMTGCLVLVDVSGGESLILSHDNGADQEKNERYSMLSDWFGNGVADLAAGTNTFAEQQLRADGSGAIYFHYLEKWGRLHTQNGAIRFDYTPMPIDALSDGTLSSCIMNANGDCWMGKYCITVDGRVITIPEELRNSSVFTKPSAPKSFFTVDVVAGSDLSHLPDHEQQVGTWALKIHEYTISGAELIEKNVHEPDFLSGAPFEILGNTRPTVMGNDVILFCGWLTLVLDDLFGVKFYENYDDNPFPVYQYYYYGGIPRSKRYVYDSTTKWKDTTDPDRNLIRRFDPATGFVTEYYRLPDDNLIVSWRVLADDTLIFRVTDTGANIEDWTLWRSLVLSPSGQLTEMAEYNGGTIYQYERLE